MTKCGEMCMYATWRHALPFQKWVLDIWLTLFRLNCVQNARDRTEDIRKVVEQYENAEFIPLRLEDAFDHDWWTRHGGNTKISDIALDMSNEGKGHPPRYWIVYLINHILRLASHVKVKYTVLATI